MSNESQTPRSDSDSNEVETLLALYSISAEDAEHIHRFGKIVLPQLETFIERFYAWLTTQPEYDEFFPDQETLERVQTMSRRYWEEFFTSDVTEEYIGKRRRIGATHARIGLPVTIYAASMQVAHTLFTEELYDDSLSAEEYLRCLRAVTKLIHLETGLVLDTYTRMSNEAMMAQSRSLMEMSTPVTQIWEGVLFLPIVGIVDSKRAQEIMNATLAKIADSQARAFVMDISGVAVVDTAVANHLINVTKATRLMGCECTISGVSPAIAQTIVHLGVDVGRVKTTATMQDALSAAFDRLGLQLQGGR